MLKIDIPGFGAAELEYLVADFTGTLSVNGKLLPGVRGRLANLAAGLDLHVLTADTFGAARSELEGIPCRVHLLTGEGIDVQKEKYVAKLGAVRVAAFGNGKNDRLMLRAARIGFAVTEGEGCATDAILAADIHVRNILEGLDLLLNPLRCLATLRF